jgi:hypothetical protein
MNQAQEGAESILDYAKPVNSSAGASFWQMCKLKAWDAAVGLIASVPLVLVFLHTAKPVEVPIAPTVAVGAVVASEPIQTTEAAIRPQFTPKKIAPKTIKTPARDTNSDDILGEFITKLEREKAAKASVNAVPAPSASNLEQDFDSRLFNFERKIP